jgi:phage shock protein A
MPQQQTDKLLPKTKGDWMAFIRNAILVIAMGGAAYGGTTAANESRIDRLESQVERMEYRGERMEGQVTELTDRLDRVLDRLEDNDR